MNTNHLKKFAQGARRKLLSQVETKLDYVLNTDSAQLREKASRLRELRRELERSTQAQLIDKVAYTWFNRFMALRFMDANDYQPIGVRVITPKDGYTQPELLDEAKQGNIPDDLPVNKQHIFDLLDGRINSANPQNEAYKELLIGACNHLNKVFPFLFERIDDFSELLMPDDLISEFSIVQDIRDGMTCEDCQEVEIIGWLYQFYISEKKDELINAKKRYNPDEIAPVTQLFTPKWIVRYMVDNTLGQFWKETVPNTTITDDLEFYIKPNNPELIPQRSVKSPEEIKFFDPCVGSAHILCYAFDVLYKIYEGEGYNPSEIPELIISKNLFGIDIDIRASQLAGFALMMKGRKYHRRFLRKNIDPNITYFQNDNSHPSFKNANILGSLIHVNESELDKFTVDESSLFAKGQKQLVKQATLLASKYDIVVTNPPYLNSSYMDNALKQFVVKEYKDSKSDLFACFLIQVMNLTKKDGLIGFISPYVWMFISSYEKLRNTVITKSTITSLIQLEYNAFEPACVPIATLTLRNKFIEDYKGSYIKLSDFKGHQSQAPKTLEAIQKPDCSWFYTANQKDFEKIPGSPIGYWLSEKFFTLFKKGTKLSDTNPTKKGMDTANNQKYLRFWHEARYCNISLADFSDEIKTYYWMPYQKGGTFRKWYGNLDYIILWKEKGADISIERGTLRNTKYYFLESITWTEVSSGKFCVRKVPVMSIFDATGPSIFGKYLDFLIGLLNTKIYQAVLDITSPTLHYNVGAVANLPIIFTHESSLKHLPQQNISISNSEWNSKETSWDFQQNELIRIKAQDIDESYDLYQYYWKNKFFQLHKNEEELNRQFIKIYGLQEELTPDVPLKDITILKEELDQKELKKFSDNYKSGWVFKNREWSLPSTCHNPYPELPFNAKEVFAQFMSYAVGCIFGRYSLDKEGLILANQGETLEDYLQAIKLTEYELSLLPDDDNIIPILDDEWFEDDIVGRFFEFLKVSFGKANFDKNLGFVEECLGKNIRKYFQKDFYTDHIKRYKKRPIYWMFSSPKGSFNVLIYMHRYTPDTLNNILNNYLREYQEKLRTRSEHLDHIIETGTTSEQNKARREQDKLRITLLELKEYERDILYPLATERIHIDLDDGVLVNYNKFGETIKRVTGLNDKKTKDKVKKFDWIDTGQIR